MAPEDQTWTSLESLTIFLKREHLWKKYEEFENIWGAESNTAAAAKAKKKSWQKKC